MPIGGKSRALDARVQPVLIWPRRPRSASAGPRAAGGLVAGNVLLEATVRDRAELFELIGGHLQAGDGVDPADVIAALAYRERIGSTALGHGVAIPHARLKGIDGIRRMYLRLAAPIAFDAPDGAPVSDVYALLVPKRAEQEHLAALAEVSGCLIDPGFRKALHRCASAEDVVHLFAAWPAAHAVRT